MLGYMRSLWLSANKIPPIKDETDADLRRNVTIATPYKFDIRNDSDGRIQKRDRNLKGKLTTPEEISGIFNMLMDELRCIVVHGKLIVNQTIEELRRMRELAQDPVQGFLEEAIEEQREDEWLLPKGMAYAAYREFCDERMTSAISMQAFGKTMNKHGIHDKTVRVGKDTPKMWKTIRLTNKYRNLDSVKKKFSEQFKDGIQSDLSKILLQ